MKIQDIPDWDAAIKVALAEHGGQPETLQEAFAIIAGASVHLLCSKQLKYGKDNILEFGHHGLVIRSNDKLKRLKNKFFKNVDLGKEGVVESWGDMLGYGALGLALEKGWFTLPLTKEDVK